MRIFKLRIAFGLLAAASVPAWAAAPEKQAGVAVIRNVNLVTLDSRGVMEGASVVSRYGKIDAVLAKGATLPEAAVVIDGSGKYLIPGLIDAHVHYEAEQELASFLRYGVTSVFSLGTRDPEMPAMVEAMERQRRGAFVGAHLYATGPSIANHRKLNSPAEVGPYFDELQSKRLTFAKVYNDTSQPVFDEVVRQAKARKMGVFGHLPRGIPIEYVLSHGLDVVAHMEEFFFARFRSTVTDSALPDLKPDWSPDYSVIDPYLAIAREHRVAIIPNLVASYNFRNLWVDESSQIDIDDARYMAKDVIADWRKYNHSHRPLADRRAIREEIKYPFIRTMAYRAQQQGVLLLAGSDSPLPALYPGRSLHQELNLLVAAGLTSEQALKAATVNAGEVAKRAVDPSTCIGVIQAGCEADLVLLDSNPLENIRNVGSIAGVMADGHYYTRAQLDLLRARAAGIGTPSTP